MPKQKTHSGLKKRIKVTGKGKLLRGHAYTGHQKVHKSHQQNKDLHKRGTVDHTDFKRIKSLISDMM